MSGAAEKKLSKAVIIRQLQQVAAEKQRELDVLQQEHQNLRTREVRPVLSGALSSWRGDLQQLLVLPLLLQEVLLQQVTQQGDNLHFVALAAAQVESSSDFDLAKTLVQDLEVYELLGMLGRDRNSCCDGPEPFTTQRLRAAVTPERVAAMRATTVSEVAARLKSLTMRMCMLLAGGPGKAHLFADSIEAVVNEYGEYGLLLHVAADWINLEIGTLNLDTLQVQEPPPGYWECVVDNLELQEQQVQTLAMGFSSYQQKSKPIISALHSTVSSIRAILDAGEAAAGNVHSPQAPSSNGVAAPGSTGQQQPFWHFLHNTLDTSSSGGRDAPAEAAKAAADTNGVHEQQRPSSGTSEPMQLDEQQQQQQQQQKSRSWRPGSSSGSTLADRTLAGQQDVAMQPAAAAAADAKPWQEFGLGSHGCLTAESAEQLEQHMTELMQAMMKLREMHRTVTWLFLNTLNARQHALFITHSWPYWSRPLTMCQYIAEQHQQQHSSGGKVACMRQNSNTSNKSSDGGGGTPSGTCHATATGVSEGVLQLNLGCNTSAHRTNSTGGGGRAAAAAAAAAAPAMPRPPGSKHPARNPGFL